MFVCAIQRAIDLGYVSATRYGSVVQRAYDGILARERSFPDRDLFVFRENSYGASTIQTIED